MSFHLYIQILITNQFHTNPVVTPGPLERASQKTVQSVRECGPASRTSPAGPSHSSGPLTAPGSWECGTGRGCCTGLETPGRWAGIQECDMRVNAQPKHTQSGRVFGIPQLYQRNLIFQEEKKVRRSGDLCPTFHDQRALSGNVTAQIPSVLKAAMSRPIIPPYEISLKCRCVHPLRYNCSHLLADSFSFSFKHFRVLPNM